MVVRRVAVRAAGATLLAIAQPCAAQVAAYPKPLPDEATPAVAVLPDRFPASYVLVQDGYAASILDGRAAVIDVAADDRAYKGQVSVAQFGSLIASTRKPEIYVAETFYSRLIRGERTDAITIWDRKTLTPMGEILLSGGKRGESVSQRNSLQLTNNEKWALLFNFTPASSVSVIDLDGRKVLNEIDLPGCSLVYPTGQRGFMSLCADGTMTSIVLDEAGKLASTATSKAFNDIDNDPMFMAPVMVGRTAWFVTFRGMLRAIDLSGPVAREAGEFALPREKTNSGEWRPGGWQVITASPSGQLYVLMNPAGAEGSHKNGGTEVWVVDPATRAVARRITLRHHGVSVEVTTEASPSLVVSRPDGGLDIYDATSGAFRRSIAQVVTDPLVMAAFH